MNTQNTNAAANALADEMLDAANGGLTALTEARVARAKAARASMAAKAATATAATMTTTATATATANAAAADDDGENFTGDVAMYTEFFRSAFGTQS